MKNRLMLLCLTALCVGLLSSNAMAQDAPRNALRAGSQSLAFGVPGGGNPYASGTFGYWYMVTPKMNLGINVGLSIDPQLGHDMSNGDETTEVLWDFLLAPTLKFYGNTNGNVVPFGFGQLNLRLHNQWKSGPGTDTEGGDATFGIAGGMGVEWFVVTRFSISGQVGVGIDIVRAGDQNKPFALGTFTSGLAANIYF